MGDEPKVGKSLDGTPGIKGQNDALGVGVEGLAKQGIGVYGKAEGEDPNNKAVGVKGFSFGRKEEDFGVLGESVGQAPGVKGDNSRGGPGVEGTGYRGPGVRGTSGSGPGVHGKSLQSRSPGVHGEGTGGPGVRGTSDEDCGGRFESQKHGQIYLKPVKPEFASDGTPKLPRTGAPGELLAVMGPDFSCTLWLCVVQSFPLPHHPSPVSWAPVQLGPAVQGEV
ncbi:hypothetical protein HLK59_16160 [Streptomyces sp. S3(2020)]|nr:hypothetical protein [Streptomyces sp. S3(2020)]